MTFMALTVARSLHRVSPMRDDENDKPKQAKPIDSKAEPREKPQRRQFDTEDGDNPLICRGID